MIVGPAHSLRTRLLWLLSAAIMTTLIAQAMIAYRTARVEADEIFDYHMQQMALSLSSALRSNPAEPMADIASDEEAFDFVVQIWSSDGLSVFRSASRTSLPQRSVLGFSDVKVDRDTYRVFSMQSRSQVIQVAQNQSVRRQMAGALALRTIAPVIVVAPILLLLVWWVVTSSLAPVSRVRQQIAQRQADELQGVSEAGLPDEIQPLVHELNLLFQRVRIAFDAQKHFVADAAHELRSPLAALKLQVQSLQRASDHTARERAVARLTAGVDRAARLVEQLLDLAHHQAAVNPADQVVAVSLAELARTAVAEAAQAALDRHIDIGISADENTMISGHPDALRIMMRNLIENAIKYTPENGTVAVEVHREMQTLRLAIEDSGPGIAASDRERVFDRFYRVAGTDTTGSGLGLAIVKSIVDLHGASLMLVKSDRLGGVKVEVRFVALASSSDHGDRPPP